MGCCLELTGITTACGEAMGGIQKVWITCSDNIGTTTVTNNIVSAITLAPTTAKWYLYEFEGETGSVTTTINKGENNGTLYYSSEITLQFAKQDAAKRLEIASLAVNKMAVIVEDSNGIKTYYGVLAGDKDGGVGYPVTLSSGTAESGTAFGDFNGYNITLSYKGNKMPYTTSVTPV